MYNIPKKPRTTLKVNNSVQGETLETKIFRAVTNKQPLEGQAKLLYTERKAGILASTNIRTDRFEVAVEAADKIAKSYKARREDNMRVVKDDDKVDGGAEPTQGKPVKTGTDTK